MSLFNQEKKKPKGQRKGLGTPLVVESVCTGLYGPVLTTPSQQLCLQPSHKYYSWNRERLKLTDLLKTNSSPIHFLARISVTHTLWCLCSKSVPTVPYLPSTRYCLSHISCKLTRSCTKKVNPKLKMEHSLSKIYGEEVTGGGPRLGITASAWP